jgi:hypothetical protein
MPASEDLNIAVTSGNCGNPRRRGAGRAAIPETGQAAWLAEAAAAEDALVAKTGKFRTWRALRDLNS